LEYHLETVERDIHFEVSVGEKVREFRKKLGWSQQVLGDYANLERNQIRRVERAKNSPGLAIITSIAKALGRQPFELLKTNYPIKIIKNLDTPVQRRKVTTAYIREISHTSFLTQPKAVDQIVKHCEEKFDVDIPSSATSAVLKKLVDEKILKRIPAKIRGRFLYQKK
jgi:transcriptional regulator with XRE-family HTH domain